MFHAGEIYRNLERMSSLVLNKPIVYYCSPSSENFKKFSVYVDIDATMITDGPYMSRNNSFKFFYILILQDGKIPLRRQKNIPPGKLPA